MKKGILIIISGHGATGKTTLGNIISEKFNIPAIGIDGIKEEIWNNVGWGRNHDEWKNINNACFDLMYYFSGATLSQGKALIVEANFKPEVDNERFEIFKKKYNCNLVQIYCKADKSVIEQRFRGRLNQKNYHPGHRFGIEEIYGTKKFLSHLGIDSRILQIDGETLEMDTTDPGTINYESVFEFVEKSKDL